MADGVGGILDRIVAVFFFGLAIWLGLPEAVSAQDSTTPAPGNGSNFTEPKVCHTHCCDDIGLMTEARLACQEFRGWGIKDKLCVNWQQNLAKICRQTCSNCTEISKGIFDQCLFFLQAYMEFTQALDYCAFVEADFADNGRCESSCNTTVKECWSDKGKKCMSKCGNFQKCECFMWRGTGGEPTECDGETVIKGYLPNVEPPMKYSCAQMGDSCQNHLPGKECGKYKWCESNMCLIKNVTCPITDGCQLFGACETSSGKCYYTLKDDGQFCDDGINYTKDNHCMKGKCIGWSDECERLTVECSTRNPCLFNNATCHRRTGACQFVHRPEGTKCSDTGLKVDNGRCVEGLCMRYELDLCAKSNCSNASSCEKKSVCDEFTGKCIVRPRPEGTACMTPNNTDTFNNMCFEGQCKGDAFDDPHYKKVGEGFCADAEGKLLQRYFGDTFDEEQCQEQCTKDSTCIAYSYGFHLCNIYFGGANRSGHPSMTRWGQLWMLGILEGDTSSAASKVSGVTATYAGEQVMTCMEKLDFYEEPIINTPVGHEVAFGTLLLLLTCAPGIWLLLWKLRQHPEEVDAETGGDFHQDDAAIQNLQRFKELQDQGGGILELHGSELHPDGPAMSPRDGNPSSVAAAPAPAIGDAADENKVVDDSAKDAPSAEDNQVGPAEVTDPRGQVTDTPEKEASGIF